MYGTDVADNPADPAKPVENPPVDTNHLATEVDHATIAARSSKCSLW